MSKTMANYVYVMVNVKEIVWFAYQFMSATD